MLCVSWFGVNKRCMWPFGLALKATRHLFFTPNLSTQQLSSTASMKLKQVITFLKKAGYIENTYKFMKKIVNRTVIQCKYNAEHLAKDVMWWSFVKSNYNFQVNPFGAVQIKLRLSDHQAKYNGVLPSTNHF